MSASAATQLGTLLGQLRRLPSHLWATEARLRGADLRGAVVFLGRPILSVAPGSEMIFEGENNVFSSPRANPLGNAQPCVLRTLAPGARLVLGQRVGLSGTVLCALRAITVGEGTIFGSGAMVFDNDFHKPAGEFGWTDAADPADARPVQIGRGCFIGARAIVLKGVTIGDRAIVGAGAVVARDVPAGARAVGNPAGIILPAQTA